MDYLQPGLREIPRQAARLVTRARLAMVRRQRVHALTQLGLLGWQGADFDEATQRQVDEIQNVEREQSRHLNGAATLATEIRRLIAERETAQRASYELRKQHEAELRKASETRAQLERQVSEKGKVEPHFQQRIPELDRELRETNKLYSELLIQEKQTPKLKQELVRLRERIVAIPNEKSDLRTHHLRAVTDLRTLEESLARQVEAVTAAQQRIHYAEGQWQTKEAEITGIIKAREREKASEEKQYARLESAKSNPYLRIGEVLSESNLGPLNQPEVLQRVREIDVSLTILEGQLADSLAATEGENKEELRVSLWLWYGAAAVLMFVFLKVVF